MNNPSTTALAIVIPVYNEEENLKLFLDSWITFFSTIPGSKIFVVNDGSTDRTDAFLQETGRKYSNLFLINQKNAGHGAAVLRGYTEALKLNPDWIFQMDSDNQIPAEEFKMLWERKQQSPFILACRSQRKDPWYRIIISRLNRVLLYLLFRVSVKDPNIPFRLMQGVFLEKLLAKLNPHTPIFAPNIFLSLLAAKQGIPLLEIPVHHKQRESGIPSLKPFKLIRICLLCMSQLIKFRRDVES